METDFRVVLIEDDPDLRALIKITLEYTSGWEVTTAEDGPCGLQAVKTLLPDAVVVDLMMPGMDGYEVCRRLKHDSATAHIPLVLLTARRELDEDRIHALGIAGVLAKPFDPDRVAAQILELCGGQNANAPEQ